MSIRNPSAWAIGVRVRGVLYVRRVVWGRTLAREEKRKDEVIQMVHIVEWPPTPRKT